MPRLHLRMLQLQGRQILELKEGRGRRREGRGSGDEACCCVGSTRVEARESSMVIGLTGIHWPVFVTSRYFACVDCMSTGIMRQGDAVMLRRDTYEISPWRGEKTASWLQDMICICKSENYSGRIKALASMRIDMLG